MVPSGSAWAILLVAVPALGRVKDAERCVDGGCDASYVPGRYAHCAVTMVSSKEESHMVIYGGRGFTDSSTSLSTLGDVWSYDMQRWQWTLVSPSPSWHDKHGPQPRSSHACALVDEDRRAGTARMISFGGMAKAGNDAHVVSEVWALELTDRRVAGGGDHLTGAWRTLTILNPIDGPRARFDHSLVPYANGLLVYGGCEASLAFSDVWYLSRVDRVSYRWQHLAGASPQVRPARSPLAPPPLPSGSSPASPPAPAPPAEPPNPGRRCAHTAVPYDGGMVVFGGRLPVYGRRRDAEPTGEEPTWLTLSDAWRFEVSRSHQASEGWSALPLATVSRTGHLDTSEVEVNRSDHSCILRQGSMYLFGGLFTDVHENTIYIMKDFLSLHLPSGSQDAHPYGDHLRMRRLQWGPAWRFDHTMVVAPRMKHPDSREDGRMLIDAPLLYGGGGGMEIFADLWVYDDVNDEWYKMESPAEDATVSLLTLIYFTIACAVSAFVIVCVFVRRLSRGPRRLADGANGGPGGSRGQPAQRRGVPAEIIEALPRVQWSDVVKLEVKLAGGEGEGEASAGAPAPAPTPRGVTTSDDGEELCPVCLCGYELDDTLLRLPCEHLFHEHCVSRWLAQDSSCPQCRFNLMGSAAPPLRPSDARSASGGWSVVSRPAADVEGGGQDEQRSDLGTEMVGRPLAGGAQVAPHPAASSSGGSAGGPPPPVPTGQAPGPAAAPAGVPPAPWA